MATEKQGSTWPEVVQAASVIAALCYGAAWVFWNSVLQPLGVQPESVGVSADYLLVRATVAAAILTCVVGGLLMPSHYSNWLMSGRAGVLRAFHVVLALSNFTLLVLTWFALIFILWALGHRGPLIILLGLGGSTLVVVTSTALVLRAVGYTAISARGPKLAEEVSLKHAAAAIMLWAIVALLIAYAGGQAISSRIKDGDETRAWFFDVRYANVVIAGSTSDEVVWCGLLLGEGTNVMRLYLPSQEFVVAVPLDDAHVVQPVQRCD